MMLSIASRTPLAGSSRGNSQHKSPLFSDKNPPKKELLANTCFFWPVVLDYKHSRLNGLGSPSGIETYHVLVNGAEKVVAKWPGKPVWD